MALSLLLSQTFAQNDTTIADGNNRTTPDLNLCSSHLGDFNPNAPVNSTGSVNIHWDALMMDPARNDWTFTLTYNETRNQSEPNTISKTMHYLQGYISAPNVGDVRTCVLMFGGLNSTSSSGQRNGCDGVLDDSCASVLRNITFNGDCDPSTPQQEWISMIEESCGAEILSPGLLTTGKYCIRKTSSRSVKMLTADQVIL